MRRFFRVFRPGLGFLGFFTLLLLGCPEEKTETKTPEKLPNITIEKFSLTETKQGKKLWILDAVTANVYDNLIHVDTVRINFYGEKQTVYSILTSRQGTLNTASHNIVVKGQVVLWTDDSSRLYTDSLFWQNDSQKILTDSYVRIVKKDSTVIEGNGLKTTPDLKKIEIIGDIKGTSPIQFPKIR
jgi:LPS export ABC transporter protein LptC